MRVLLLLPSLIAGAVMAVYGGYWQGLIFVGASVLVQLVMLLVNRPPTVTEGSIVQVVGKTAFLDGRRMPNRLSRWPPTARRLLFDYLRQSQGSITREHIQARLAAHAGTLPVLGFDRENQESLVELDWHSRPHALIVGPTGSGKSGLIGALLDSITRHVCDPIEAVWYFDPKAGHSILAQSEILTSLRQRWPEARFELISETHVSGLGQATAALANSLVHRQGRSQVRVIVIVEELSLVLADRMAAQAIQSIAAAGRTAGVRIVATNQSASGLPRGLLVNLGNRIVMRGSDESEFLLLGLRDRFMGRADRAVEPGIFEGKLLSENRDFSFLADWSS